MRCRRDQRGFTSAQAITIYAFSLLVLVWLANLVVFQYGRGAVRAAINEGARAGARVSASEETCQARAQQLVDDLLSGPLGGGITITCTEVGGTMRARASGSFASWMPPVPNWTIDQTAVVRRSQAPS